MARRIRGLAAASHPLPSVAVTAFAGALAVTAHVPANRVVLLVVAALTGQLSVGWLNDFVDRDLDRQAGRSDKPLATGVATEGSVRVALGVSAAVCVVTSLALGVLPGLLHLAAVASAYGYDLLLKATAISWLPFAVSFGLLPCVVTTARVGHPFPSSAIVVAGAALGVGAHFANTVKDTEADAVTGVRGLPQRLGPRWSVLVAAVAVAVAGIAVVIAIPGSAVAWLFAAAGVAAALLAARVDRRLAFPVVVAAAGLVVAGVVLSGGAVAG